MIGAGGRGPLAVAMEEVFQGSLFSSDFLTDSIQRLPEWRAVSDADIDALARDFASIFARFPIDQTPNESQTEDDLIWPILARLGWTASLRQQNLAARGRDDVPDGLLFADDAAKDRANQHPEEWRRYGFGLTIVESKRWRRPLDRQSGRRGEETAPSTQMLRYLRRVDDLTDGALRWGFLTNGGRWRLYYQGARSVSEQFFELDLPAVLGLPGHDGGLFALSDDERRHSLRVFLLVFGRDAFVPTGADPRTFHQKAIEEGRFYEERVSSQLAEVVFNEVFPTLARAIADAAPDAPLEEVRQAALILLYRLLFVLYAEDRDLLPVRDKRYDDYGLRKRVREDVGRRKDVGDVFSDTAARYWSAIQDLCLAINRGDGSIGLPPYNGGLFDPERTPLLATVRLGDADMATVIDALSYERTPAGRRYINYRNLSVQHLGSIYERLLEHEIVREEIGVVVRPNAFARKGSGSYYTPDDLVRLIIDETVRPLVNRRVEEFTAKVGELEASDGDEARRLASLSLADPAEKLLDLKVCDPAMGSGHFLVSLVDYLSDQVIAAMAEAEAAVEFGDYVSPLIQRIADIRKRILVHAQERGWTVDPEQLDDRHIVRRMVMKRCIYGVDKNPMAVELAKVSLWLHTFTVGAPLSFLDHHLRCGDSLFGSWVAGGVERASKLGAPLFLHGPMKAAKGSAASMRAIEGLTDADIAETHRSKDIFEGVQDMTGALDAILSLIHALEWLDLRGRDNTVILQAFLTGQFGDPIDIALGKIGPLDRHYASEADRELARAFDGILHRARELIVEEHFLNWQVAFPGVWSDWEDEELNGGFDAVIGNPPWDRMKLQQVEWFAARRPEIARAQRAADRQRMINALVTAGDPLAADFAKANERAEAAVRVARRGGVYPLLSGGDVNIYSLFVERAMSLVRPEGLVGLLTPSGIASDKTAAPFFKSVATEGRLKALFDFENRRTRYGEEPFFPDVDSRFKFCAIVMGCQPTEVPARCAFFLQDVTELADPNRCFEMTAEEFARVNPNTGTAPIFRSRRDADLTTAIYGRLPVLVDRSSGHAVNAWPVTYCRMFDMTNDSGLFRTKIELEETEGAYPIGGNRFDSPKGVWLPLYEGKMVQAFDHRAANVVVNAENRHRPAQPVSATPEQHENPEWLPESQFWVDASEVPASGHLEWLIGYKMITAPTNMRTMIAAALPRSGVGNSMGILLPSQAASFEETAPLILACLNSVPLDFAIRQKIQGQNINWYIVEQLPVVSPNHFESFQFGSKSAAEIIRPLVLELTYTAHDMAPFARDLGHVDADGDVLPPFRWDDERRLLLRAKLDAVFFHLYGVTDREDVRYIYSTFPIVERQERAAYGAYRSRDLCLAYMNALAAGQPDADIRL